MLEMPSGTGKTITILSLVVAYMKVYCLLCRHYMYICMCMYVCICSSILHFSYTYVYACMYVCMYVCMYYVCMYV